MSPSNVQSLSPLIQPLELTLVEVHVLGAGVAAELETHAAHAPSGVGSTPNAPIAADAVANEDKNWTHARMSDLGCEHRPQV